MRLRQWYLGIAVAAVAAAFLPMKAHALATPNLTNGYTGVVDLKFNGYTAENTLLNGATFGNSCTSGAAPCQETTFGAGIITSVVEDTNPAIATWSSGNNGEYIGFYLYGIADQSAAGTAPSITLYNTGANNGNINGSGSLTTTGFDGLIHLDLYVYSASNVPCFTGSSCVKPSDRTSATSLTGVTNGQLIADLVLVPGVVPNGTGGTTCATGDNGGTGCITLQQTVNATSDPAAGGGSFYLDCVSSGPVCSEFNADGFTANSYIADMFGKFTVSSLIPSSNNGWQEFITDPVQALPVPEPGSLALLGSALIIFGGIYRRRRKGTPA